MRFYKWLTGLVAAIFYTLIIAWFSSYLFVMDVDWYDLLVKPKFVPSSVFFEVCVTIVYLLTTVSIAHLIVKRNFGLRFIIILLMGILSVVFILTFFYLQQIYIATAIMALIWALSLSFTVISFPRDFVCTLSSLPILVWHSFLFVITFTIALHN